MVINEVGHTIVGHVDKDWFVGWGVNHIEGKPFSVGVDVDKVLEIEKSRSLDLIGFYHTHPNSVSLPSVTDYNTMESWCIALGRPLLCAIEGIDGLTGYWFIDDEQNVLMLPLGKNKNLYVGEVCREQSNIFA